MFLVLLLVTVFATVAVMGTVLSPACLLFYGSLRTGRRFRDPRRVANRLLIGRLLPTLIAVAAAFAVVAPAFLMFEPRGTSETIGYGLWMMAAAGSMLLGLGIFRTIAGFVTTARVTRTWSEIARPVHVPAARMPVLRLEADSPIAAVAGVLRPRLFLSSRVLDHCTPAQLTAIVAHETAHVESRDNLKRLALLLCVDPLWMWPASRTLRARYAELSEQAADDAAIAAGTSSFDLADALIAVARMGQSPAPCAGVSSFLTGPNLEQRIQRLVEGNPGAPPSSAPTRWTWTIVPLGAGAALAWNVQFLQTVHTLIEAVVRHTP